MFHRCVVSLIVLMMMAGTAYDVLHVQIPRWASLQEVTCVMRVADDQNDLNCEDAKKTDERTPLIQKEDAPLSEDHQPGWLAYNCSEMFIGNVFILFNDAVNTFYLRLYGVRQVEKNHSDSEGGNPLPLHGLLFSD